MHSRWVVAALACAAVLVPAVLVPARPARAHTELAATDPAPDAVVHGPVDRVELTFTTPAVPAGDGIDVLDGTGRVLAATVQAQNATVTARLQRPLRAGDYGVRWTVRSGDAHPVRGSFAFRVDPGGGPTPAAASGAEPSETAGTHHTGHGGAADGDVSGGRIVDGDGGAQDDGSGSPALAAALADAGGRVAAWLEPVLRALFYACALGAVGVLVFLVVVWQPGAPREVRRLARAVGRLAGLAAVVAVAQVVVRAAGAGGSALPAALRTTLSGAYAVGMGLRVVGGVLVLGGVPLLRRTMRGHVLPVAGGAVDLRSAPPNAPGRPPASRRRRLRGALPALAGAALLIGSFGFVGHAATAQPRVLALAATITHVAAAAVWGGGVLGLALTLAQRRAGGSPLRAGVMAVRFSALATVCLLLVAAAGTALALVRAGGAAALWGTSYGSVLLAKVVAVALVAALGAHNHLLVVPRLRRRADDPRGARLWALALAEVAALVVVLGLTAVLVGRTP